MAVSIALAIMSQGVMSAPSIVKGIIGGGTTAHLYRRVERDNNAPKKQPIDGIALQLNHILLLVGNVLKKVNLTSSGFSLVSKNVFLATPFLLLTNTLINRNKEKLIRFNLESSAAKEKKFIQLGVDILNAAYFSTSIITTVALFSLGNIALGITFLGVLSIDVLVHKKNSFFSMAKKPMYIATKALAVISFVMYGVRILFIASLLEKIALVVIGCQIFLSVFWNVDKKDVNFKEIDCRYNNLPAFGGGTLPNE